MEIFSILNKIRQTLIQLVKLYKILIAQKKAEKNPGRSKTISRIRKIANEYEVDPDLAVKVAKCESNLNPLAININVSGSVDRGLFQWNDFWHPEVSNDCAFNIECSTAFFCQAVKNGNLNWWNSSRHCWG